MKKSLLLIGAVLGMLVLGGCEMAMENYNPPVVGDPIQFYSANLATSKPKDKVLWQYRLALAQMRHGQYAEAKQTLDDALLTIDGLYAKDKNAENAKGLFEEEAKKTFLGEPYERVMANYYRGILCWMDGERDNARARFRNGEFLDGDAEQNEYKSDYVLLDYLDGYTTAKLGDDGSDAFKRSVEVAKLAKPPEYDKSANVIFFVEMGTGPMKYGYGEYMEMLKFIPGKSLSQKVIVHVKDKDIVASAYDDLSYQATTRGGRVMDHILGNKAVFKDTTKVVGEVALGAAAIGAMSGNNDFALASAAVGLISLIASSAANPAADIRTWNNLPQYIGFGTAKLEPGDYEATADFVDAFDNKIVTKNIKFTVTPPDKDTVVFVSDRND